MEYFKHGDLQHCLFSVPPLPELEVQQITSQILEGLQFMHQNGYSHRDLKPGVSAPASSEAVIPINNVHPNRIS